MISQSRSLNASAGSLCIDMYTDTVPATSSTSAAAPTEIGRRHSGFAGEALADAGGARIGAIPGSPTSNTATGSAMPFR